MSFAATLLNQQSAKLNKVKGHNIRSICGKGLFHSLRALSRNSGQMKILKDPIAQTTTKPMGIAYCLWLPFAIRRVLNLIKLKSYDLSNA